MTSRRKRRRRRQKLPKKRERSSRKRSKPSRRSWRKRSKPRIPRPRRRPKRSSRRRGLRSSGLIRRWIRRRTAVIAAMATRMPLADRTLPNWPAVDSSEACWVSVAQSRRPARAPCSLASEGRRVAFPRTILKTSPARPRRRSRPRLRRPLVRRKVRSRQRSFWQGTRRQPVRTPNRTIPGSWARTSFPISWWATGRSTSRRRAVPTAPTVPVMARRTTLFAVAIRRTISSASGWSQMTRRPWRVARPQNSSSYPRPRRLTPAAWRGNTGPLRLRSRWSWRTIPTCHVQRWRKRGMLSTSRRRQKTWRPRRNQRRRGRRRCRSSWTKPSRRATSVRAAPSRSRSMPPTVPPPTPAPPTPTLTPTPAPTRRRLRARRRRTPT
mmetsp:Transcript_41350/g.95493  ORF Transcript_41350/g.95493 Transcript_41350/m.95493 type:complete len:381 (+) Transcript_41350:2216-3358(+)